MNRSQQLLFLLEEIAGSAALVYHRTGASSFLDPTGKELSGKAIPENIIAQGFAEGRDGMYGPGIYATYRLDSQFRDFMSRYGEYLIKCRVNLQGYIILEYSEAKKVYKENYALRDQLRQYYSPQWLDKESRWIEKAAQQLQARPQEKTSGIARDLYELYRIHTIVPGMLFTGGHDDTVLVTYRAEYIVPVSYAHHPVGTGTAVAWMPIDRLRYRGRMHQVHALIRVPEKISSYFSEVYQKLGEHTRLSRKDILQRLSKLHSLSIDYASAPYRLSFSKFPSWLVVLIKEKFRHREGDFHRLMTPILDERFKKNTESFCLSLKSMFPGALEQCQVIEAHTIRLVFVFSTVKVLLRFLKELLSHKFFNIRPVVDFLLADTPTSRAALAKSCVVELLSSLSETDSAGFFYLTAVDREKITAMVQNYSSTE